MHLAALLLVCLPAAPAPGRAGATARVEVLEGRALLAGVGVVARLEAGGPERAIDGPAHLELPAGSRARVTWSGHASLVLEGRNVLAWHPGAGGGAPAWDLAEVGLAHLELRRGPLDLELAGGWGARLYGGACALRGLPGEGVELDHQAGLPFDLWPPQRETQPSAPFTVLAGARVRLHGGSARPLALAGSHARLRDPHQRLGFERGDAARGFPAWRGFAWPWNGAPLAPAPREVEHREDSAPDLPEPSSVDSVPASALPAAAPGDGVGVGEAVVDAVVEAGALPAPVPSSTPEDGLEQPAPPALESRLREHGVLVLTPYGPRWLDATRAVDPALPPMQAARRRR
jgi:hypothetical protein